LLECLILQRAQIAKSQIIETSLLNFFKEYVQ